MFIFRGVCSTVLKEPEDLATNSRFLGDLQAAGCEVQASGKDPFDCNAALSNFYRAWTVEKDDFPVMEGLLNYWLYDATFKREKEHHYHRLKVPFKRGYVSSKDGIIDVQLDVFEMFLSEWTGMKIRCCFFQSFKI